MGGGPLSDRAKRPVDAPRSADWASTTRSGIAWSLVTFVGGRAVTFFSVLVLARILGPREFGVVAAVLVFLTVLELAADLGMKATVVYEQEEGVSARVQTAFTTNLLIASALTGVGILCAPVVADFFNLEDHTDLFRLGSLSLLVTGIGNIHDSLLLRDMRFRKRTVPQLGRAVVRGLVSVTLAVAGLGALALVIGMLAGALCWTVLQWSATRFRPDLSLSPSLLRSMAGYGSTASLLGLLALIATRADAAVIGRVLGERALGLYTIAFRVPELLIESVSLNTSLVAFPALSRQRADERHGLGEAVLRLLRYQALYCLPMSTGLAVLAPPLIVTLFSAEWAAAGGVMSAIAIMSGIYTLAFPMGEVFRALGRLRILVVLNLIQLPFIVGAIIAVADAGILTVAWTRAAGTIVHAILVSACVMRVVAIAPRRVVEALRPGILAAVGVVAGAGTVRLLWDDLSLMPLIAGTLLGALGGFLVLRTFAPRALEQARGQFTALTGASRRLADSRG